MGFTIENYSLFGLQPQSFYVSIQGNYTINKIVRPNGGVPDNFPNLDNIYYNVAFMVYYAVAKNTPVIIQKQMLFTIDDMLPDPADIYTVIYDHIKKTINYDNIYTITDE